MKLFWLPFWLRLGWQRLPEAPHGGPRGALLALPNGVVRQAVLEGGVADFGELLPRRGAPRVPGLARQKLEKLEKKRSRSMEI